ncbi:MAG: asparagine synthase (glutamine-hydrolyzing) [Alphaproteobacteria bacterium]|nr:asparagine synthase (glutamine-hydrolyzing) [Alphaproteobacteria bacterium]
MCGIAGFLDAGTGQGDGSLAICHKMADALAHRGPDDSGVWHDHEAGIFLAFRRLSIIDLSAAGHQPMMSANGRYVMIYNGEIYNHRDLRRQLDAQCSNSWRGSSDSETLLAAIENWGFDEALERSNGMFALALWDREKRQLTLARDRFGEKPLYYGWQGDVFLFGSELKAFRQHPQFEGIIDRESLCLYLRYNCIPAPNSIYRQIHKLPPGSKAEIDLRLREPVITQYWSPADHVRQDLPDATDHEQDDSVVEQFSALLDKSVSRQMIADVPLGAMLSGGIDSSLIVSCMQAQSQRPVNTFTIGFDDDGFSEAKFARRIAAHLGTHHEELVIRPLDARDVIPSLPHIYDEPFSDSSQIPTYLVSRLARQHVTVALTGDGADELFGGYNRYRISEGLWPKIGRIPFPIRSLSANLLNMVPASALNRAGGMLGTVDSNSYRWGNLAYKSSKLSGALSSKTIDDYYLSLLSHWRDPAAIVVDGTEPRRTGIDSNDMPAQLSDTERMMLGDMTGYLPDDILVKVDRASMAVSLETRAPYLDRELAEFALGLPFPYKIREGRSKWIMREALTRYVPANLLERPKMGFAVPIGDWLRGPLREWAEELLDENRLRREAFFDPVPIREKWGEHLAGKSDWQYHLWDVLMFQAWLESLD